jgi:hypothetical protein
LLYIIAIRYLGGIRMGSEEIIQEIINIIKRKGMTYAECERLLAVVRMEIRAQAKI